MIKIVEDVHLLIPVCGDSPRHGQTRNLGDLSVGVELVNCPELSHIFIVGPKIIAKDIVEVAIHLGR